MWGPDGPNGTPDFLTPVVHRRTTDPARHLTKTGLLPSRLLSGLVNVGFRIRLTV